VSKSAVISISNLTKKFGDFTAVDHLNLEIKEGEIFGLLGPNGAGKTTTLLMLSTVIKPTEGTATVCGYDIKKSPDKVRRFIGISFQEPKLLWVNTPWDIINWHAKVSGLSAQERKKRVRWILKEFDMWEHRGKSAHALSGGMRKRVEIAKLLIQRPKIAIIDEPTAQIDVVGKYKIWGMIKALREEGSTIILATNELYEADYLSERVAIMHKGKLLVCDTPKNLKDSIPGGDIIDVRFDGDAPKKTLEELKNIGEVTDIVQVKANHLRIYLNQAEKIIPKMISFFSKQKLSVISINMKEPSLDDVFLHYTGLTIEEAERTRGPARWR
jgi:ABC-2 type transport system ATP-binding protein